MALVTDYPGYAALNERLRARGFTEDTESGVICRWRFQGIIVDIMPPDPSVLGFSNELYPDAIAHPALTEVDGVLLRHIGAPQFIGTKLLAFEGRGRGDLWASHDLEDLIAVVNSRPEIVDEVCAASVDCRRVVLPRLESLRKHPEFKDSVEGHLANDVPGQVQIVLARIDAILSAGLMSARMASPTCPGRRRSGTRRRA